MTATTISRGRRQKLLNSLALLTHDAEQEKSFASKAARGQIFKKDDIDVNTAFALTNQIKLASVFEVTLKVLKDSDRLSDLRYVLHVEPLSAKNELCVSAKKEHTKHQRQQLNTGRIRTYTDSLALKRPIWWTLSVLSDSGQISICAENK